MHIPDTGFDNKTYPAAVSFVLLREDPEMVKVNAGL